MNAPPHRQTAAPPARALLILTALVLLLHGLMLRAAPTQWGLEASPGTRQRPLITRTIEIRPPSVAATAAPVALAQPRLYDEIRPPSLLRLRNQLLNQ